MITSYRLTTEAQHSLIEIESYSLETFGKQQTVKYLRELANRMEWFAQNQKVAKLRPELTDVIELFSYPQASHTIYFQSLGPKEIVIIDVLHKSMEPKLHLFKKEILV